ncbi:hypothetical protein IJ750_02120 [bacterium]|nr:hypothetical protein [bacterium]
MSLSINPMSSIKAMIVAGSIALASQALSSCSGAQNNKSDSFEKQKIEKTDTIEKTTPIDLSKPNLPEINGRYVNFKDLNGKTIKIETDRYTRVIYEAIKKFSTKENPDITDTHGFKLYVFDELKDDPSFNTKNMVAFLELYHEATDPAKDKGDTISVKEYTNMMADIPHMFHGTIYVDD